MKEDIYFINQSVESRKLIKLDICGITYPDRNYEITRQKSKTACIEYIDKGTGTVCADDFVFNPVEGDSYFLHEGQNQHYFADSELPWKKYFINVSGKLLSKLSQGYEIEGISHFKGLNIKEELCDIIELVKNSHTDCTSEIILILNSIFFKMRNHTKDDVLSKSLPYKMRDFLDAHIAEEFRISQLCEFASKSESQTIKIFKKEFKITPYSYYCNKKNELAKSMLLNTSLSIKQIAYTLNYADEYYFSNSFKQQTGKSPLAYRKSVIDN